MRVRHVDWDVTVPSLWVRLGTNNGVTGYCGEGFVSDQIGNLTDKLGPWSFDFLDTVETPDYVVCNCVTEFSITTCTRAVPEGWISSFEWTVGPSCNTNQVTFTGGVLSGGTYSTDILYDKFLPAQFWLSEFQAGDWIFTPADSCGLNGTGPECFRVIRSVGDDIDVNCDNASTNAPASWGVLKCSITSRQPSAYDVFTVQAGDSASAGYLKTAATEATQVVVSWVINADRDTVRLMVEEIAYNAGLPGWEIVDSDYIEFAYTENWWLTGRSVGDYTVTTCGECDAGSCPECLKCPATATLALVIEEDPACCLSGTFDLYYNSVDDWWQSWPPAAPGDPPTSPGVGDIIGGPAGVCGYIEWVQVTCIGSGQVNLQFLYEDVNGDRFTASYDLDTTCDPSFATDYATLASNPFAPGLCDGGFFRGSKLRVVEV